MSDDARAGSGMTAEQRDAAFAMAGQEMEYRVELFNRLVGACYDKCIDKKFKEGDLNVGENSCVDRCASKYWETVAIVGQMLGAQGGGGELVGREGGDGAAEATRADSDVIVCNVPSMMLW